MNNPVPIQALLVGVIMLILGLAGLPYMRASFERSLQNVMESAKRVPKGSRVKSFAHLVQASGPSMTLVNSVLYTAFRWLCIGLGALAILTYLIGFFGVNLAEMLMVQGESNLIQ